MPVKKLTVRDLFRPMTPGRYSDGGNLYLSVCKFNNGRTKSWLFIYKSPVTGKQREMGLGSAATFDLTEMRYAAKYWRKVLYEGKDPIEHRKKLQRRP